MRKALLCLLLAMSCLALPVHAQQTAVNIMGGPEGSTAQKFAELMAETSRECGYETTTHSSVGALENLLAVRQRRNTQFGLVQSDVLEYLRAYENSDPEIAAAIGGVGIAFPLYEQEVHILARRDVAELPDLRGKRVSLGAPDSGDFLTATVMFDLLGYSPSERLTYAPAKALEELKAGRIDAMFFVDGAPSQLLADAQIDPEQIHLLNITDPILEIAYLSGMIKADDYAFLESDTQVVTVKSVALTFDYVPEGRNRYNTRNCNIVADIAHLTKNRLGTEAANDHPKWSDIDLDAEILDWTLSVCAERGLAETYTPTCR